MGDRSTGEVLTNNKEKYRRCAQSAGNSLWGKCCLMFWLIQCEQKVLPFVNT